MFINIKHRHTHRLQLYLHVRQNVGMHGDHVKGDIVIRLNTARLKRPPSQAKVLAGAETCAKRNSKSPCLVAILAFDRIAGLYDRYLNYNRGIFLR